MKGIRGLALVSAALVVAGLATSSIALALLGGVVLVGGGLALTLKQNRATTSTSLLDTVRPEDRVRLRPIQRLRDEIEALVAANRNSAAIAVVGAEAVAEAQRILEHAATTLQIRAQVRRPLAESGEPSAEIAQLERDIAAAQSEPEREALQSALAARQLEAQHYEQIRAAVDRIDVGLKQAEAALAEMKARLAASAAEGRDEAANSELRDTLGRLKTLDASLDEAQDLLRVHL